MARHSLVNTLIPLALVMSACIVGNPVNAQDDVPISVPKDLLAQIQADAAQRTGRAAAELRVVVAEAVTWSDASLGCPRPGIISAQVLTPGYRVVLRAGEEQLNYHAGSGGKFVLCPAGQARPPSGAPGKT